MAGISITRKDSSGEDTYVLCEVLPEGAPWTDDLVGELTKSPDGTNDDQVDTLSLLGRMLNEMVGASPSQDGRPKEPDDPYMRSKRRMQREDRHGREWWVTPSYGRNWRLG